MVLIISETNFYTKVKMNNSTSVYSVYLKQGIAQGVVQRHAHARIADMLTSTGDHSPDGWKPNILHRLKRRLCL